MNAKSTYLYAVGRIDAAKLEVASVKLENRTTGKSVTLDPSVDLLQPVGGDVDGPDFGKIGTYQDEVWATVTFRREDGKELNLSESDEAKIYFSRPVGLGGANVDRSFTGNSITFRFTDRLTEPGKKPFNIEIWAKDRAYKLSGPGVDEKGNAWGSCTFEKKPFSTVTVTPSEKVKKGTTLTANWKEFYSAYPDNCQWYRIKKGVEDSKTLIVEHEVKDENKVDDKTYQDTYEVTEDDVGCDIVAMVTCYGSYTEYYKEATSDPVTVDKYENTNSAPTNGKVDDGKDTFTFTPASGKSITDYEYSTDNGETWTNVTVNPIQVGALRIPAGYFQVREKATDTVQPDAQLSYEWKVGGTVVQDVSDDSYTLKGEDVGRTVTVAVAEKTGVGGITYSGSLTPSAAKAVAKRPVTVNISDWEKSYGEKDPAELEWEITEGSLVEEDALSISGTRTSGEDVGQYSITMVLTEEKQNKYYEITSNNNPKLTIRPANANMQISVTPDEPIGGNSVTVTASAKIVGNNLMESGWEQPGIPTVSVSEIGSLSDTVTMTKQADGSWQGTYTIPAENATGRLKFTAEIADKNYAATSTEAFVKVTAADYTLVPDQTALDFGKETYEYNKPEAKELSVTNKGNSLSQITDIQLTGTNADDFELVRIPKGQDTVDIPTGNTLVKICTVQPKTDLKVGIYGAQLTITYTGGGTASVDLRFVVEKKKREVPDNAWTVDWTAETVAYEETVYEINDAQDGTGKALATGADLGAYEGKSVYIRAIAQDENNYIPSDWKEIVVPKRPAAPGEPTVTERTTDKISVKKQEGQEYRLREKDGTWGEWQDEPVFDGLAPGTEYELETRKKVVDGTSFVGEPTSVPVTTSTGGTAGSETPTPTPAPAPGETAEPGTPIPTPGGTIEPGTPTPTPEMPSKEEQTKNELTLNTKMKVSQSGRKVKVSWEKISGADGDDVYFQYCGKKYTKKSIIAVKSGTTKATVKKVNGKPLNQKKNYRIYVLAYKLVDGKKITLGKTITAHIVGKMNTKYTNVKAVKVKKSSYRLKKGKTAQIKASTVLESPGKKQLPEAHVKQFRYATTNKKVANVSKKGNIKAVGTGTCTIYVYARNGYAKKIKVTVK